ncbi:MAG: hypothetical protein HLUCCA12_09015 [Rhodobacteraceae bacterium HLUCCA12]|nr:MAG: hypothetical protein HLUCCA12_09015 [Rhodobacteraceae bacterium HLUCCA12]
MRWMMAGGLVAALAVPAQAQDWPRGIAFVQAPEMSSGVGTGHTPEEGFAAATRQCVDGGARAEDCFPTNWCQPAGWSVDLFVMHQEGVHWHEVVCGLPSRAAAEGVAAVLCDPEIRDWLIECAPVQVYDEAGIAQLAQD